MEEGGSQVRGGNASPGGCTGGRAGVTVGTARRPRKARRPERLSRPGRGLCPGTARRTEPGPHLHGSLLECQRPEQ